MYAIIRQGGKQFRIAAGDEIVIDRIKADVGKPVVFDKHLLINDGGTTLVRDEDIAKYAIEAELVDNFSDDKVLVFKYRARKGYRRTRGHRQRKSRVKILAIEKGKSAVKKRADTVEKEKSVKVVKDTAGAQASPVAKKETPVKTAKKTETKPKPASTKTKAPAAGKAEKSGPVSSKKKAE